jgi:hypothetical protein
MAEFCVGEGVVVVGAGEEVARVREIRDNIRSIEESIFGGLL